MVHALRVRKSWNWALLFSIFLQMSLAPSSSIASESLGFSLSSEGSNGEVLVEVLDEESFSPLPGAKVTLEELPSSTSPSLKALSVSHTGYAGFTLLGIQEGRVQVFLKRLEGQIPQVIGSGTVGGWLRSRGKPVHLGLAFRSLSAFDLLSFHLGAIVSPLKDTIQVMGERKIPSNITLPKQNIPLPIGSVRVEKTRYRFPVPAGREIHFLAMLGSIDSQDLMSIGNGLKPSLLNRIQLSQVAISDRFTPSSHFGLDLQASESLVPFATAAVTAPPFTADVLVAAFTDLYGDRKALLPTDIRAPITVERFHQRSVSVRLKSTRQELGRSRGILTVAISQNGKRLTGIVQPAAPGALATGDYLPVEEIPPSSALPDTVRIHAPNTQGLGAAVFEASVQGLEGTERKVPVWWVYSLPSAGSVEFSLKSGFPQGASAGSMGVSSFALMQLELSQDFEERSIDGLVALEGLRRFSRASWRPATTQ